MAEEKTERTTALERIYLNVERPGWALRGRFANVRNGSKADIRRGFGQSLRLRSRRLRDPAGLGSPAKSL